MSDNTLISSKALTVMAQKHFKGNLCFWFLRFCRQELWVSQLFFFLCCFLGACFPFLHLDHVHLYATALTHQSKGVFGWDNWWLMQVSSTAGFCLASDPGPWRAADYSYQLEHELWECKLPSGHLPLGLGLSWGYTPTAQLGGPVDPWPFSWQHQLTAVLLFDMWAPTLQGPGRLVPRAASTCPSTVTVGPYDHCDFLFVCDPEVTPPLSHSNSPRHWLFQSLCPCSSTDAYIAGKRDWP